MQIITINIPKKYIETMASFLKDGLYPSRSELMRVAIRGFLIRELNFLEAMMNLTTDKPTSPIKPAPAPSIKPIVEKKPVKIDMRSIRTGWKK